MKLGTLALATCNLLLILPAACVERAKHWEYDGSLGGGHWREEFEHCGKKAQSPVNIRSQDAHFDPTLKPVRLKGFTTRPTPTYTLRNNGHTVQMSLPSTLAITSLPRQFTASQLHLHWGSAQWPRGSEHLIDGQRSSAELHVVLYNSDKYRNVSEAMRRPNGLAVLAILLEVGKFKNPAYENILSHLESIKFAGQEVEIPAFAVRGLLPKRLDQYFTYRGSLTTPPCYQSVRWIVFHQRVLLSLSQLKTLRTGLFRTHAGTLPRLPLVNNRREVQPLRNRKVKASFVVGWAISFRRAVKKLLKMLSVNMRH